MASTQAKAVRRADAMARLSTALGIKPADLDAHAKGDAGMALVMTLERVADAVDKLKPAVPGDALRAAILAASDDELTAIPGIGDKSLDQVREWAKTPLPTPPITIETVDAKPMKTIETVEVTTKDKRK